ncbi:hypothetical protein OG548_44640 [Streptomyces sp. NBC_01356]|nr:hypothetical protein [Streptomyces sp. NBC_01356]
MSVPQRFHRVQRRRSGQMQHRVDLYLAFTDIVHTVPGANLTC